MSSNADVESFRKMLAELGRQMAKNHEALDHQSLELRKWLRDVRRAATEIQKLNRLQEEFPK